MASRIGATSWGNRGSGRSSSTTGGGRTAALSSVPTVGAGLAGVDLTDLDAFASGFPHDVFERHRREAPVFWHEPTEHTPDGEGFWSVASYAESLAVVRAQIRRAH